MAQRSWWKRAGYTFWWMLARWLFVLFFRYRRFGAELLPPTGGGLICSNHQSFLDPVLVGLASERRLNFLARKTLFRFRPFGWFIDFLDSIPIDRDGFGLEGLKETIRRTRDGELVLLFPEGTRSHNGQLQPLKAGLCTLARRAKAPLIPVGLDGAFQAWPRSRLVPGLGVIHVVIGPPISADEIAQLSDTALLAELERRIFDCWQQARNSRQD